MAERDEYVSGDILERVKQQTGGSYYGRPGEERISPRTKERQHSRPLKSKVYSQNRTLNKKLKEIDPTFEYTKTGNLGVGAESYRVGRLEDNPDTTIRKIVGHIMQYKNIEPIKKNEREIREYYNHLSEGILPPAGALEKITTPAIAVLSIASLFILSSSITGNVVAETSSQVSKVGLAACLFGIIALAAFKGYKRNKTMREIRRIWEEDILQSSKK